MERALRQGFFNLVEVQLFPVLSGGEYEPSEWRVCPQSSGECILNLARKKRSDDFLTHLRAEVIHAGDDDGNR